MKPSRLLCRHTLLWALFLAGLSMVTLAEYANKQRPEHYNPAPPFSSVFLILELCCATVCVIEMLLRIYSRSSCEHFLRNGWFWTCAISVVPLILYLVCSKLWWQSWCI
jgi:NADH:ubiquinone oxidoreductase subunit H